MQADEQVTGEVSKSLNDYLRFSKVLEDGRFLEKEGGGFIFELTPLEGALLDGQELSFLHQRFRGFFDLSIKEELHLTYKKTGDFEEYFEKRFEELSNTRNNFAEKIFLKNIDDLMESASPDVQTVFTPSLHLCYHLRASKKEMNEEKLLSELEDKRSSLSLTLRSLNLSPRALLKNEIIEVIAKAASGRSYVSSPQMLEEWPTINIKADELLINDENFRALTLKTLPESFSEMGMIRSLLSLPLPLEISLRFSGKDSRPVKKALERKRQILHGLSSRKAMGDPITEAQFRENDEALRRLTEQNESYLEMSLTVGLRAKKENKIYLRKALSEILQTQGSLGHVEFTETKLSTFDAFLEMIPGASARIYEKHSILSANAIHFLPIFKNPEGHEKPVLSFKTTTGEIFKLNPLDSNLANYNWLISGTSGAGKSFFVNSLLLQSQSLNPRIFIVDIGGSYNKLTQFLGGKLIHLNEESHLAIGPFFAERNLDTKEEQKRKALIELIFLEMMREDGRLLGAEDRAILSDALKPILDEKKLPEHPVTYLCRSLQASDDPRARRLSVFLRPWLHGTFYGRFVDHAEPLSLNESVVTFDLKGLSEFADLSRVLQLIITSAIWQALKERNRFTWIVLDEVAFSLLKTNSHFVDELISTSRKHMGAVVVCVQDLAKITTNPAGASILQNTQIKAILQQRGDEKLYAEPLSLREVELSAIRSLERQKGSFSDIFLMLDEKRACIRYTPTIVEYLLSTSDPKENQTIEERLSHLEGSFPERILKLSEELE